MSERMVTVSWVSHERHENEIPLSEWLAMRDDPENGLADYEGPDTWRGTERDEIEADYDTEEDAE